MLYTYQMKMLAFIIATLILLALAFAPAHAPAQAKPLGDSAGARQAETSPYPKIAPAHAHSVVKEAEKENDTKEEEIRVLRKQVIELQMKIIQELQKEIKRLENSLWFSM